MRTLPTHLQPQRGRVPMLHPPGYSCQTRWAAERPGRAAVRARGERIGRRGVAAWATPAVAPAPAAAAAAAAAGRGGAGLGGRRAAWRSQSRRHRRPPCLGGAGEVESGKRKCRGHDVRGRVSSCLLSLFFFFLSSRNPSRTRPPYHGRIHQRAQDLCQGLCPPGQAVQQAGRQRCATGGRGGKKKADRPMLFGARAPPPRCAAPRSAHDGGSGPRTGTAWEGITVNHEVGGVCRRVSPAAPLLGRGDTVFSSAAPALSPPPPLRAPPSLTTLSAFSPFQSTTRSSPRRPWALWSWAPSASSSNSSSL